MAPSKRRGTARSKASARDKKLDALLRDFHLEVRARVERVRAEGEALKKDVENLADMELLRLPVAMRKMNWLAFFALEDQEQALAEVTSSKLEMAEITQLASQAIQTPFRAARKAKQAIETIEEEVDMRLLPAEKRSRQEGQAAVGLEGAPQKVQTLTKRAPNSKKTRPPSSRSKKFQKRPSKGTLATPTGQGNPAVATTPFFTPAGKFDSSVFKTPGLRARAAQEQVFNISANGSPLAEENEPFLLVPLARGQNICINASELSKSNLTGLSSQTLSRMERMSSQIAQFCNRMGSRR